MYLRHLTLADFRSYESADVPLGEGITTFVGSNGQGKTNLVEAIYYLATLGSHRVANDGPLVRAGASSAVVHAAVVHDGREQRVELEINPGKANRGRLGRAPLGRQRDILGALRCVMFAPEDLALVKGDPAGRRRFLDELLISRQPRWSAARSDYDKIVRQRNALLKSARKAPNPAAVLESLPVWDAHLAQVGANLTYARLRLMQDVAPYLAKAYAQVSDGAGEAHTTYRSSLHDEVADAIAAGDVLSVERIEEAMHESFRRQRAGEVERGLTLVGPHRDDVELRLGELPAKGYASHGESWSFALGLKLAAFSLLRHDLDTDPVLILDDVFAELDSGRRGRLAELIGDAQQVLITAAVGADVPSELAGARFDVVRGAVTAA